MAKGTLRDPVGGNIVKSKLMATAALICFLCCSTATAQWPLQTFGVQNDWEVEVGARILDRPTKDDNANLSLITVSPTDVTVFTGADAADLNSSIGADFRFARKTNYDHSWEVRGFFNSWDNFESRSGALETTLFSPTEDLNLPFGTNLNQFDWQYESQLFSIELLCKKAIRPGCNLLFGPRYVDLNEQVTADSNWSNQFFDFQLDTVNETHNHMPGFLLGLDIRRPLTRDIFFTGGVKGSLLANLVSTQTTRFTSVNGFGPTTTRDVVFEDSRSNVAGLYEMSARLHYDISPGNVSCYLGYEAFWMDAVAVAPTQLFEALQEQTELNTNNTTFVHGLAFGLMLRTGGAGSRRAYR